MAASVKQGEQMVAAAKHADRKLMVAYRARYEPYNREVIEFSREKTYGEVRSIAAHKGFVIGDRLGKGKWRIHRNLSGGGALVDIGIYSIQACRYIAGTEPLEVSAFAYSPPDDERFREVEESISFIMRFPNGLLATGSASWNYSLQNYYRVGATNASYGLDPATSNGNLRMNVTQTNPRGRTEKLLLNTDQIVAQFDHFSDCVTQDQTPLTPGEEGLRDLRVIEALYKSVQERRPISLS